MSRSIPRPHSFLPLNYSPLITLMSHFLENHEIFAFWLINKKEKERKEKNIRPILLKPAVVECIENSWFPNRYSQVINHSRWRYFIENGFPVYRKLGTMVCCWEQSLMSPCFVWCSLEMLHCNLYVYWITIPFITLFAIAHNLIVVHTWCFQVFI